MESLWWIIHLQTSRLAVQRRNSHTFRERCNRLLLRIRWTSNSLELFHLSLIYILEPLQKTLVTLQEFQPLSASSPTTFPCLCGRWGRWLDLRCFPSPMWGDLRRFHLFSPANLTEWSSCQFIPVSSRSIASMCLPFRWTMNEAGVEFDL